jgi:hypothetical protein
MAVDPSADLDSCTESVLGCGPEVDPSIDAADGSFGGSRGKAGGVSDVIGQEIASARDAWGGEVFAARMAFKAALFQFVMTSAAAFAAEATANAITSDAMSDVLMTGRGCSPMTASQCGRGTSAGGGSGSVGGSTNFISDSAPKRAT